MRISDWSSDVCSSDLDDLAPDRITRARYKLMTLLKERTGGQVALIAYSGDAFTVAPMTDDAATVAALIDSLSPSVMPVARSDEHTSELQSLMRISYAVLCLKKKRTITSPKQHN